MKQITQERLLNAIDSINDQCINRTERLRKIVTLYGKYGYQNIVEGQFKAVLSAVELDSSLVALTEEQHHQNLEKLFRVSDHYEAWRNRVYRIQQKYQISGLVPKELWLGDFKLETEQISNRLSAIESDLEKLRELKYSVFDFWLGYISQYRGDIYAVDDNDKLSIIPNLSVVRECLSRCDWADVSESVYFTSPSRLRNQGFDCPRNVPEREDDHRHHEVHLDLGIGEPLPDNQVTTFIFCNEEPTY